ncbi:PRC-barrel domain-containing protein [Gemmobacter lanyuensis]
MALTAEDLLGATIYDTAGDAIGTVHDLVLDKAVSGGSARGNGRRCDDRQHVGHLDRHCDRHGNRHCG